MSMRPCRADFAPEKLGTRALRATQAGLWERADQMEGRDGMEQDDALDEELESSLRRYFANRRTRGQRRPSRDAGGNDYRPETRMAGALVAWSRVDMADREASARSILEGCEDACWRAPCTHAASERSRQERKR